MLKTSLICIASALLLWSCNGDDGDNTGPSGDVANVRLLQLNHEGGTYDLRVNNELIKGGVQYPASSGYGVTSTGQVDISVHNAGETAALKSAKVTLGVNTYTSVYAFPPTAAFSVGHSTDRLDSDPGTASIKLVNASYNSADLFEEYSLTITGRTTPLFTSVKRLHNTGYAKLSSGLYSFTLRRTKGDSLVVIFEGVELLDGAAYTIVLHGTPDETDQYPLGLRMYNDIATNTDYVDLVKAPNTAQMMFIMAIHASEAVSIAVDGPIAQVTNLGFRQNTNYLTFASGAHTYGVQGSVDAFILDQPINLGVQEKYSVILTGTKTPRDITPLQLKDPSQADPTAPLVRFVHLAPDAGAVSVEIKDLQGPGGHFPIPGLQNIQFRGVSVSSSNPGQNFLKFSVPGTYTLQYRDVATDSVVATQKDVEFTPGKIYTLWYGGLKSNNTLQGNLVTHN